MHFLVEEETYMSLVIFEYIKIPLKTNKRKYQVF